MEYTITQWRGKDNYECNHCPYATLDKENMRKHLWFKHRLPMDAPKPLEKPPEVKAMAEKPKRRSRRRASTKE